MLQKVAHYSRFLTPEEMMLLIISNLKRGGEEYMFTNIIQLRDIRESIGNEYKAMDRGICKGKGDIIVAVRDLQPQKFGTFIRWAGLSS